MFKIFKFKNIKDWKTSIIGILGGLLIIAGIFYPDKLDPETQEIIMTEINQMLIAIGALIPIIAAIFGSKDGDKK